MAKSKINSKAPPPLYKIGDIVSFPYGDGRVAAKVVEDRGCLGRGGRRLYGIHFEMNPGELRYSEMGEEELTAETVAE
jgi:hypothetical protein